MKPVWVWFAVFFGALGFFAAGFVSGRVTAPEQHQKVVYVERTRTQKPERKIYTSKRGKKYYLTPAGNRVYLKTKGEAEK